MTTRTLIKMKPIQVETSSSKVASSSLDQFSLMQIESVLISFFAKSTFSSIVTDHMRKTDMVKSLTALALLLLTIFASWR